MFRSDKSGFYQSKEWRRLRKEVLQADKYECQRCKSLGYYTKANTVHHINHVELHPELKLEKYYKDAEGNMKRNLISVCHNCHEVLHGYRAKEKGVVLTEEKW